MRGMPEEQESQGLSHQIWLALVETEARHYSLLSVRCAEEFGQRMALQNCRLVTWTQQANEQMSWIECCHGSEIQLEGIELCSGPNVTESLGDDWMFHLECE